MLRANVYARPAQNTLVVFHGASLHHSMDIQAHRTLLRTCLAINALVRVYLYAQSRPPEDVPDPPPDDHKGGHPAHVVASRPPTKDQCQAQEEQDDDVVDHVPGGTSRLDWLRQGHAPFEVVEWINGVIAAGSYGQDGHEANPGDPDAPLDPVELAASGQLVVDGRAELLQPTRRTHPAAPQPTHEQGGYEHQAKDNEAGADDALRCALQDHDGREVVERDGEEQKRHEYQCLADSLSCG